MKLSITGWEDGAPIPTKFAFGKIPAEGRFEISDNISPAISWSDIPEGTKSFALICHDPDVPSSGEDVNIEGKEVPASLPRVDFYHWVLVNIPANITHLDEGAASNGVTPKGKMPGTKPYGTAGLNNYTDWFAGDTDMGGDYGDYDGPCPPWNDSIIHHYHFTVYALDTDKIDLPEPFTGPDALAAIEGHVLDKASYMGTYTMNRDL
ncbi:MAG: YbhB/YbcL family Raf kinase inhibitor-like protein [Thalassospira sp.]|uniref:YbhB/YbcL family Raf kinase inhibitor-like protein n=1 Tax=Thalassospira sp. TaxID=1912094 RepID=UPI001B209FA0|nr:YbhB/YbcL family Raf kinase inhibitor-like protein [Thalassospira sp.]MBO6579522.1 YbhB/YbcL family Raf kinase inhibitor-like protein [Thalassospira sp.]MBO6802240.1 YbhB/YbcL family Raf kinase inhibitor-like protein [Thalassospira sp.]MBO6816867.1 YbhB/YbcL family Raf kinase inhibitor-like protein [Thalassospira sp.]MBO6889015.1 YbhB/YbcL family Raf kinase inhibitor-like protein [Thalassospira sp.]